jgi:hypothetical protein
MPATLRIGLWIVQIAIVVGIFYGSVIADPYFNTDTYAPGAVPHQLFPVVAVRAQDRESKPVGYRLITWRNLEETRRKEPSLSFKLPESQGHFELSAEHPQYRVRFNVTHAAGDGQLVEVFWSTTGDHVFQGKYLTDGISVWPVSFYMGGLTLAALVGFIGGLVAAWLFGWQVRRRWSGKFDAPKLPTG